MINPNRKRFSQISFDMGTCLYMFEQEIDFFHNFIFTNYMDNGEALTLSIHSFAYLYRLYKKTFVKIAKLHNFILIFLIMFPIFINLFMFYGINLNQDSL